jgi:hypothetical protein
MMHPSKIKRFQAGSDDGLLHARQASDPKARSSGYPSPVSMNFGEPATKTRRAQTAAI